MQGISKRTVGEGEKGWCPSLAWPGGRTQLSMLSSLRPLIVVDI